MLKDRVSTDPLDRAAERNARLLVALRHTTSALHDKCHEGRSWWKCERERCKAVRAVIEYNEPYREDGE